MSYSFGVDVLGAGPVGVSPLEQLAKLTAATPPAVTATPVPGGWESVPGGWQIKPTENDKRVARNVLVGGVIGGAVGSLALGAGGAYLWPAHRILGFFLGSFVGWPMGSTVGGTIGVAL